ncbi:MAG: hypothetical protein HOP17_01655 [Acidobacteria bacterium]|nr:hypothetical protein [Acidobacteriota bacterium]
MKTKLFIIALAATFSSMMITVVSADKNGKEAKMVREAKITMAQARKVALGRVNGTVERAKLEREKGKLLFEFEIHNSTNAEAEIHVDAITGEIFAVKEEGGGSAKEKGMFDQIKVSMDEAEQTALNKVSGATVEAKIERERGKILYEFEIITTDGAEVNVHVDAISGEVESTGKK